MQKELVSPQKIAERIEVLAREISAHYAIKGVAEISALWVANGAIMFAADLTRALQLEVGIETIRASSYLNGSSPCREPVINLCDDAFIKGRHVLLIDDIIDSGCTASAIEKEILKRAPASLKTCFLLSKPARRKTGFKPDYVGFEIEDKFVFGYGLDYNYRGRNLPGIMAEE